jgi:hypothetical protein
MAKNALGWITAILVIIGAINWGLVGLLDFNLVTTIFGSIAWLEKAVYILVGLAGIWELVLLFKK